MSEAPRSLLVRDRPVAELDDAALEAEVRERRRARAATRGASPTSEPARAAAAAVARADASRYYAMLEVPPSASLAQVEASYRALSARYDPQRHAGDPEKFRTAQRVADELTRAYRALVDLLRR